MLTLQSGTQRAEFGRSKKYRKWWIKCTHHLMIENCSELKYM